MRKGQTFVAKSWVPVGFIFVFTALFSSRLSGIDESKGTLPKIIAQTYVIDSRYLLGCDFYNLGVRYSSNKEYDKAIASFRKAVELLPKDHPGYVLARIEIQRLTDPAFLEETKKKYEEIVAEEIEQQLNEIQEEIQKVIRTVTEEGERRFDEKKEQEREERLKKIARQLALEIAIENLQRQAEQEREIAELIESAGKKQKTSAVRKGGAETGTTAAYEEEEEAALKEKIRLLIEAELGSVKK